MTDIVALAGLGVLALPLLFRRIGRRLRPRRWSVLCATALAGGSALVLAAGVLSSLSTALDVVGLPRVARECDLMFGHLLPGGSPIALVVLAVTVSSVALGVLGLRRSRLTATRSWVQAGVGTRLGHAAQFEIVVLDDARPRALSVPGTMGRRGQVLLTTGLLGALQADEVKVVCAHEEAHLRLGHHRYLILAAAVERALWYWPPARTSARALRLALERWADEVATGQEQSARARLASALLTVASEGERPLLAAFSALDGLVERLSAMSTPMEMTVSPIWWPVLLFPGLLLGAVALYALSRLGHSAYCLLTMSGGCHLG